MITINRSFEMIDSADTIVYGIYTDEEFLSNEKINHEINEIKCQFNTKLCAVNTYFPHDLITNKKAYFIGLGMKNLFLDNDIVKAFITISKLNESKLIIDLDSFGYAKEIAFDAVYGFVYGNYRYTECKSDAQDKNVEIQFITKEDITKEIDEAFDVAIALNNTRDLVNKPYNYLNAEELANYAIDLVEKLDDERISYSIYNKNEITKLGMNAFLSVNKGSTAEPKLICLKYFGDSNSNKITGLVGKGIMFDTGGYSLKGNMNTMKCDMAGAATVLGVFEAIVKQNIKKNIIIVICATDNRINGEALLPDDVITCANKKTVEIVSTDAEGRLTLADGLWYVQKEGATEVIDIATLTGAVVNALGEYTTGLFTNNRNLISKFMNCAKESYEFSWELPITDDVRSRIKSSKVADMYNSFKGPMGASGAAAFLEEFINTTTTWLHIDIAGTAFHTTPNQYEMYGATGVMVRTIYRYLKTE